MRRVGRLRDENAAEIRLRAAHRRDRHGGGAIGLRAEAYRLAAAHALNLVAHKTADGAGHHQRCVLRCGDFGGRGIRRRHPFRVRARPGARRLQLEVADVIAVHVGEQHEMDRAQSRIVAAGHVVRRVVEEANAGRILENDRAIVRAELSGMRADRRYFHVLGQGRECGERKGDGCTSGLHVVPTYRKFKPPFFLPGAISPNPRAVKRTCV